MKRPTLDFYCTDPSVKKKQQSTFWKQWSQPATVQEAIQKAKEQNGYELEKRTEEELTKVNKFDESFLIAMTYLTEFFREYAFITQLFKLYKRAYTQRVNTDLDTEAFKLLCRMCLYTDNRFRPEMTTWQLVRKMDKMIDNFDTEPTPSDGLLREFAYHSMAVQPRDADVFDHPQLSKNNRNEKLMHLYSVLFRYSFTCQALLEQPMGRFFDQTDIFFMNMTQNKLFIKDILGVLPEEKVIRVLDAVVFRPEMETNTQQILVTWFTTNVLSHEILLNEPSKYFYDKTYSETEARHIVGEYRGTTIAHWRNQTAVTSDRPEEEESSMNPAYKRLLSLRHSNATCLKVLFLAGLHTALRDFINRHEFLFHFPHKTIVDPQQMHHLHSIKEYLKHNAKYGVGVVQVKQYYMLFHRENETEVSFGYKTQSIHRAAILLLITMIQSLDKRVSEERDPRMTSDLKAVHDNLKRFFQLNILRGLL